MKVVFFIEMHHFTLPKKKADNSSWVTHWKTSALIVCGINQDYSHSRFSNIITTVLLAEEIPPKPLSPADTGSTAEMPLGLKNTLIKLV